MDQEKVDFIDGSMGDVERAFCEGDASEAKLTLCVERLNNLEITKEEAAAFRDKPVVYECHAIDANEITDDFAGSLEEHSGDSLAKSDDMNEIIKVSNSEIYEKKVDECDEILQHNVPCSLVMKYSEQREIDSAAFKSVESTNESLGIIPQKSEEGRDLAQEIIIIDDSLDSDETETNVSRSSNDDLDQIKSNIQEYEGENVSACSKENVSYPKSEKEENVENVVKILDNSVINEDDHLEITINKLEKESEDIKIDKDLKLLSYINENKVIDDEDVENIIHEFDEAQNTSSTERIQPKKISCEQWSESHPGGENENYIICSEDEEKTRILQATLLHLDHEDYAIVNNTKEENGACLQGVEVLESKERAEIKDKRTVSEKPEGEGLKESQRPRSRSYPFKVLVSGLPLGARREDVMCYFSQFGEVLKLWDEGRHRANVLFADEESYKKAVCVPDPYFDDHKLLIRSISETIAVLSGIPRNISAKDAEKAIRDVLEETGALPCRIVVPLSDPAETSENHILQGHAFVTFNDPLTLQKAEDRANKEPFVIVDKAVKMHLSCNEFYEKFCIRVFPLPPEHPRVVIYHNILTTFEPVGEIVAIMCQYVGNSAAYAGYVLFESEDSVKKAKEMEEVKILGEFTQVQAFHPFEHGQGFRHLWLKVLNLPPRATITEIKHHFGHDRGILNIELDLDFGSCFMHMNSESAMQRCLRMHQSYLRGKCIAVMIAEDHPDRAYYREMSRRGRRPNFKNNTGRRKAMNNSSSSNFNGKTFTSAAQPQGSQDRRGFERGDRKFSKSRSNNRSKEVLKDVKEDGDGVKIADTPAV